MGPGRGSRHFPGGQLPVGLGVGGDHFELGAIGEREQAIPDDDHRRVGRPPPGALPDKFPGCGIETDEGAGLLVRAEIQAVADPHRGVHVEVRPGRLPHLAHCPSSSPFRWLHPERGGPQLVAREDEHVLVEDGGDGILVEGGLERGRPQELAVTRSHPEEGLIAQSNDLAHPSDIKRHRRGVGGRRSVCPPHLLSGGLVVGNQSSVVVFLL